MGIKLFAVSAIIQAVFLANALAQSIVVTYPEEGQEFGGIKSQFILGNITPPDGALTINSTPVETYPNGAFLVYLPVKPGDFSFECEVAAGTATAKTSRKVKIYEPKIINYGKNIWVDENSLTPSVPLELRAGDWLNVSFSGAPQLTADFSVGNLKHLPMICNDNGCRGSYQLQEKDYADKEKIIIKVKDKDKSAKFSAKGVLTILKGPLKVALINAEAANLRALPNTSYTLSAQKGARVLVSGLDGNKTRIWLNSNEQAWVETSKLTFLPEGSSPPNYKMGVLATTAKDNSVKVSIGMAEPVIYSAEQTKNSLKINVYYTAFNIPSGFIYDSKDLMIKNIDYRQAPGQVCAITINLNEGVKLWGYDINYSGGKLNIEIKNAPPISQNPQLPMDKVKIMLDPGHYPQEGAKGSMGTTESQINLALAREIEGELSKLGAQIILTAKNSDTTTLLQRQEMAASESPDLFISLHANYVGDGVDPFSKPLGFSIYFYQPQSIEFARAMHDSYAKNVPLPDTGILANSFAVIRLTQMPSILIESAYLILPEQEMLLNDPAFIKKLANAITEGVLNFLGVTMPTAETTPPTPARQ
ncbi:MAG: N-acetylmuramoyl-L-alanine amidase [Elusimicrobia bacterium]|nr:N-acetylmuramoyl-L-alanine amidase [Elusimicrobiota bacterium]